MGAHISAETMLDRRLHMVNGQLRAGGIVDKALLTAFLETPRQRFVAPEYESLAYLDREFPARGAASRELGEFGVFADGILIVQKGDHRGVLLHRG